MAMILSKTLNRGLVVFALLIATTASAAVDLSSPKSTAKSFYDAMSNADSSAMRDCLAIDGADQQKLADAFLEVILSGKKLADAAHEKFGTTGEKLAAGAITRKTPPPSTRRRNPIKATMRRS